METFTFQGELWEHGGEASWVFITLPSEHADQIADLVPWRRGFGSVKVRVEIGEIEWTTSLFPSKEAGSYVLPIKRAVRERAQLTIGDVADVTIRLVLD